MGKIDYLIEMAKKRPKRIVLPEAHDERVLEAAKEISKEKIADIILLSKEGYLDYSVKDFYDDVIIPEEHPSAEEIAMNFYELQKHRGMDFDDARKMVIENPIYFSAMMVRLDMADGLVAGASVPTGEVVRIAMHCLGVDHSVGVVSGVFLMEVDNCPYGEDGFFIFADAAVIPFPSAKQLVRIAISSGDLLMKLFRILPKIAFLTYSSKGSAEGESVDRAREAVDMVISQRPDFMVDGELQLDAAIIPEVQKIKAPTSPLGGKANVLIFPNLDAGNITYKAVERLGKARAIGPTLLGLNGPCTDLSRGCSVSDIVGAVALTSVRTQLTG